MGTRGLTCVIADGDYRIAQYGQWDHYHNGQGTRALAFLRTMDEPKFRNQLARCQWITPEKCADLWRAVGVNPDGDMFVPIEVGRRFHAQPEAAMLTRDHGAKILALVSDAPGDGPLLMDDSRTFAGDSLFCEYAYVIDLDQRTFEVYKGFNKTPLTEGERFASAPVKAGSAYRPVRLLAKFSLDDLPTDDAFIAACAKERDAEDSRAPSE